MPPLLLLHPVPVRGVQPRIQQSRAHTLGKVPRPRRQCLQHQASMHQVLAWGLVLRVHPPAPHPAQAWAGKPVAGAVGKDRGMHRTRAVRATATGQIEVSAVDMKVAVEVAGTGMVVEVNGKRGAQTEGKGLHRNTQAL